MLHSIKSIVPFFLISLLIFSCKKETDFGSKLLYPSDTANIKTIDTLSIKSFTYNTGTYWIYNPTKLLVGSYSDPLFGQTSASFALQFTPASVSVFETTDIADSIVLYLPIDSISPSYGNADAIQNISVYRLNERIYYNARYNSDKNPDLMFDSETILGTASYIPNAIEPRAIIYKTDTSEFKGIAINLPLSLAQNIIYLDDSVYLSNQYFIDYFKGIYVKSTNEQADETILRFFINADTKIALYYHTATDTSVFNFTALSSYTAKLNFYKHTYSTTSFIATIDNDSLEQDTVTYIQSGGVKTKILLPTINQFATGQTIAVLRAQLIIKTANISNTDLYPVNTQLYLAAINEDGSTSLLPDYLATYDAVRKEYRFDIAHYISQIFKGDIKHYGFYLMAYNEKSIYARTLITTSSNAKPIKLELTYNTLY